MQSKKWIGIIVFLFLVFIAYLLPYTALSGVHGWNGSFLFWVVIALVIIVFNVIVTRNWGK